MSQTFEYDHFVKYDNKNNKPSIIKTHHAPAQQTEMHHAKRHAINKKRSLKESFGSYDIDDCQTRKVQKTNEINIGVLSPHKSEPNEYETNNNLNQLAENCKLRMTNYNRAQELILVKKNYEDLGGRYLELKKKAKALEEGCNWSNSTIAGLQSENQQLRDQNDTFLDDYKSLKLQMVQNKIKLHFSQKNYKSLETFAQNQQQQLQGLQQKHQSIQDQYQRHEKHCDIEEKRKFEVSHHDSHKAAQCLLNRINVGYKFEAFGTLQAGPGNWVRLQKFNYTPQAQPQPSGRQPHLFVNGVDQRVRIKESHFCSRIVKLHCVKFNGQNVVASGILLCIKGQKIYVLANAHCVMDRNHGGYNHAITGEWKRDGINTVFTFEIEAVIVHPKQNGNGFDLAVLGGTLDQNAYAKLSSHGLRDTQLFDVCLVNDIGSKVEDKDIYLFGYDGAKNDVYGHHSKGATINGEELCTKFIDADFGQSGAPFIVNDVGSPQMMFIIAVFWAGDNSGSFTQNFGIMLTDEKIQWILECCGASVVFKISTTTGLKFYTFCA